MATPNYKLKLDQQSYTELIAAERSLTAQLDNFDKLESCDIDCQALRELVAQKLKQIQAIKQHFAPAMTVQG